MHICELMLSLIPFGWSVVFKCQYLGVELRQARRQSLEPDIGVEMSELSNRFFFISDINLVKSLQIVSGKFVAEYCLLSNVIL